MSCFIRCINANPGLHLILHRVSPDEPPFTNGVDFFFLPFGVKHGRSVVGVFSHAPCVMVPLWGFQSSGNLPQWLNMLGPNSWPHMAARMLRTSWCLFIDWDLKSSPHTSCNSCVYIVEYSWLNPQRAVNFSIIIIIRQFDHNLSAQKSCWSKVIPQLD